MCGNCLERVSKTNGKTRKQKELLTALPRHIGLAMIPSLLLPAGFMRLDSACLLEQDRTTGETTCCIEEVTWKDILDQSAHFLCEDGTSCYTAWGPLLRYAMMWPCQGLKMQDVLPTAAQHCDVGVAKFEKDFRVKEIHGPEKLVRHDLNDIRNTGLCALRLLSVTSWSPLAAQCSCSNVFIYIALPASGMDRVAGMVAEWFSLHERLIFHSVSLHFSSKKSSSVKFGILSTLTVGPCSRANGCSIATRYEETRSPSLKADVHKILWLLILKFDGVVYPCRVQYLVESCRV